MSNSKYVFDPDKLTYEELYKMAKEINAKISQSYQDLNNKPIDPELKKFIDLFDKPNN